MSGGFRRLLLVAVLGFLLVLTELSPATAEETTPPAPSVPCDGAAPMNWNAPSNRPVAAGDYFSYPNRGRKAKKAIRNKVLDTINSTNGDYCVQDGFEADGTTPKYVVRHGVVKVATWSFNDWDIANALKAAKARGASVQAIAAKGVNNKERYKPWMAGGGVRNRLGPFRSPSTQLNDNSSWAHECPGACRGGGGTAHSKYFLFSDVGSSHVSNIVMQTSMNLTKFAYTGQWNQATVMRNAATYNRFVGIFYESAQNAHNGYRSYRDGDVTSTFFPKNGAPDPVLQLLSTGCTGRIRVIQYAIYDDRGAAIARRLKQLWDNGCNVRIIYSISSRPVLSILRAKSGRGPVPMKQSTVKNRRGKVKKYNHSKWISVGNRVFAGSANWSNNSYSGDEQMQEFGGNGPYVAAFDRTWSQRSSHNPPSFKTRRGARLLRSMPEQPQWGRGELEFLTPEG